MAREGQAIPLNSETTRQFIDYIGETRHPLRDKAIFLMGLKSGMRIGSIAQITLTDILSSKATIKEVVILRKNITKGKKTVTAYLSHPELREAIEAWLKVRPKSKEDNLFVSQNRTAFSPNSMSQLMGKHFERAGLHGSSSHSLRRTFCTGLLKKGVDIVAVSKVMGHSSILTTQRYVHHDQRELSEVVSQL
tara:strand:- start:1352 stop:1927 length:576 start_codon:yes stop_codon:yes gene_type:complete